MSERGTNAHNISAANLGYFEHLQITRFSTKIRNELFDYLSAVLDIVQFDRRSEDAFVERLCFVNRTIQLWNQLLKMF
jgi:hypothetical protein